MQGDNEEFSSTNKDSSEAQSIISEDEAKQMHCRRIVQYKDFGYFKRSREIENSIVNILPQVEIEMVEMVKKVKKVKMVDSFPDNSMEDNPWDCDYGYLALPLEMVNPYQSR